MLEATSALSGFGLPSVDLVATWSRASAPATRTSSSARTTTPASTSAASASTNATSTNLFTSSTEEIDLQVELSIARMKAAAAQALRNQAAQMAAGGAYVRGGANLTYTVGPDGQIYATGVTLSYDTTAIADDPQATIAKMQQVRAAALASTSPSASDFAAASAAMQAEMQARLEIVQQMVDQYLGSGTSAGTSQPGALLDTFA